MGVTTLLDEIRVSLSVVDRTGLEQTEQAVGVIQS